MRLFPLLAIPVLIYSLLALANGGAEPATQNFLNHVVTTIPMMSKQAWEIHVSDLVLLLTLFFLFFEVVKSTRTSTRQIINHGLSMLTFIVALIEFIVLPGFATSTFFLILTMTLFDVIGGYTISIVAAEHDIGVGRARDD
ncbi:MAG TPA: hypothetical protein VGG10_07380 [Rhizomicrobium sp.]|jgi:hypothetical protein